MKQRTQRIVDIQNRMNKGKKRIFLLTTFITMAVMAFSQQVGSNSPYGRYGYGVLSHPAIGSSESMGGISYGLRRSEHVNPGNPASYSKLDSLTFVFDMGVSFHYAKFSDNTNNQEFYNGNLDYLAMQFPIYKKIVASMGLLPYSKVGYNFGQTRYLSDVVYQESYRASGGLNRLYGGVSYEISKNIAIGANLSFLFGNYAYSNVVNPLTSSNSRVAEKKNVFKVRALKYDFGTQITYPIDKRRSLTIGAVYSPQIKTESTVYHTQMMYQSDPYYNPQHNPQQGLVQVLRNDTLAGEQFQLPHSFGFGASYTEGNLLVGIDATYQLWKNLNYPEVIDGMSKDERFNNQYRVNAGMEYVIDPMSTSFWQRIRFRGGLSFGNSYTNMNVFDTKANRSVGIGSFKEYGVYAGFGFPFKDVYAKQSMVNISFSYTRQQPDKRNMIQQDMFKVSVGMNINELWFRKFRFN